MKISLVTLLVPEYDEAIAYYTQTLGFELIEDTKLSEQKRWVVVRPSNASIGLLLARATGEEQTSQIGNQAGGRVFLFLETEDFERDLENFKRRNVKLLEEPRYESYGSVVQFQDRYGNKWDLIQRK